MKVTIGTRGSKLALAQSEMMAAALRQAHPGLDVALQIISTKGDRVLDVALSAVGDKGLFVKELEQALLANEVDLCVHSGKDMPSQLPPDLVLAAFPERADPHDAVVQVEAQHAASLQDDAIVGTSSLRRACQLRALRPNLTLRDVRGNVDTRLRKLAEGNYDALVLAAAGMDRLGFTSIGDDAFELHNTRFVVERLPADVMLPAVAQGALAIEARADDQSTLELLAALDHAPTRATTLAERAFLRRLEGGCQVPIAAYATLDGDALVLRGFVGSLDGTTVVRGERAGTTGDPEAIGTALAEDLIAQGANEILEELRSVTGD